MNIVLTGLRGSGKTKIGKLLAIKISWDFVDLDKEIEKEENMKISEIVNLKGWEYFRAKESQVIKKFANTDKKIISTGGGAVGRGAAAAGGASEGAAAATRYGVYSQNLGWDSS